MKNKFKTITFYILIIYSSTTNAQVGIGTESPKASLDISAQNTSTSKDGFLFPSVSKANLANKTNSTYSANQESSIVYVSDITTNVPSNSPSINKVEEIERTGYYYYGNDNKWHNLVFGDILYNLKTIYNQNGNIIDNKRTVSQNNNTLSFKNTGTNSNFEIGQNLASPTITVNNNGVGIGTTNPEVNLHIQSTGNAFRLEDGTQFDGKFLTSDANGNASWYTGIRTSMVLGFNGTTADGDSNSFYFNNTTKKQVYYYPNTIKLTKGKWLVNIGTIIRNQNNNANQNVYMSLTLSSSNKEIYESQTTLPSDGFIFLGNSHISDSYSEYRTSAGENYLMISGVIPVEITVTQVTLYPWVVSKLFENIVTPQTQLRNFKENYIFAMPLN